MQSANSQDMTKKTLFAPFAKQNVANRGLKRQFSKYSFSVLNDLYMSASFDSSGKCFHIGHLIKVFCGGV